MTLLYTVIASCFVAWQSHVGCTVASGDCFAYMDVGKGRGLGAEASFLGNCSWTIARLCFLSRSTTYIHVSVLHCSTTVHPWTYALL